MPISDCEVRDPRIRRTRQALQGALRSLMQQKSFEEISVQDITDLADVNRATFYDHYNDKFALLDAMVAGGFHKLLAERNVIFDGTCPSAASAIILATCDYLTTTHASGDCNRNSAFEPLAEAGIVAAIRRVLLKGVENKPVPEHLTPEIIATTAAWAIYGAVKQWFYTPEHPPTAEIVQPILQLIFPILMKAGPIGPHDQVEALALTE
ncbi:TetR/AcrR family transcriptional regulator [Edaphobacter sp. 12200R-103]|uniref:TetR/AcrR family transcriptional regulator n=1 Tax=Edaphobacter sp. 12200R-103 TaxID=2703788 RepID=UPI00138C53BA|nr:TetR family transcriptional regulator [Edaphobacter sp. 12200R-103]QHS52460.1 TetR family transcriptional regulator [Edaphobacter sp. 12200R-103]